MKTKILMLFVMLFVMLLFIPSVFALNEPTNISLSSRTQTSITWVWTTNNTWYNTSVMVDGVFKTNVSSPITGTQTYTGVGFTKGTSHTISLRATNMNGTYSSFVNLTSITVGGSLDTATLTSDINAALNVFWLIPTSIVDKFGVLITLILFGAIVGMIGVILVFVKKILTKSTT